MNARSLSGINDVTSNGDVALTMNARSMSGINDTFGGGGDVFLAGNPNTFTGTNTFNTNRPTSTLATTPGSNDFITKSDGEALFTNSTGDVTLAGNPNTFTGTNTFNTNRPTSTLATTPGSNDFITKSDGEALFTNNTGVALLAGGTEALPQTFTEFNQFDKLTKFEGVRPQLVATGTTTNPTDYEFITKQDGVDLFGSVTGNAQLGGGVTAEEPQIFTGFNEFEKLTTFKTTRPQLVGTATPATPTTTDFITKGDGEALFTNNTGVALLGGGTEETPQSFTGFNEFDNDIVFEGGITQKDTGSANLFTQTAVGSTLNIFSQSGVNSAASTNSITQVGSNSSFNTDGTIQANGDIENTRVKLTNLGFWAIIKIKSGHSNQSRLYFQPDDAAKPLTVRADHFVGVTNTSSGDTQVGGYLRPNGHTYLNWNSNPQSGGGNGRHYWRFNWYNGSASQVDFVNLSGDNNCLIRARQYSNISDDRVKLNETPIENAMATLKKLNPVTYDYYGNLDCSGVSQLSAGLVAQEIWYKCPELRFIISTASDASLNHTDISNDDWGTEAAGVNYTEIQPYMIKVIQDHQTTIEKLEERLAILETKINEL